MAKTETTDHLEETWIAAMTAKGHVPVMRDEDFGGGLDFFVKDIGFHNGPGCASCGKSWCWHCVGPESIDQCSALAKAPQQGEAI